MSRKYTKIIIAAATAVLPALANAQAVKDSTLTRTVVVENQYAPTVEKAVKISKMPAVGRKIEERTGVEYAEGFTIIDRWATPPLSPAHYESSLSPLSDGRAWLSGNIEKCSAGAAKTFFVSKSNKFAFNLFHNGKEQEHKIDNIDGGNKWNQRRFDTGAYFGFQHKYDSSVLKLEGDFSNSVFNYINFNNDETEPSGGSNQHHMWGGVKASYSRPAADRPLGYRLRAGYRFFDQKHPYGYQKSNTEYIIHTAADFQVRLGENVLLTLGEQMDNMLYSAIERTDRTSICSNPSIEYKSDDWRLRLGAHVDVLTAHDGGLEAAPDVSAEFLGLDHAVIYIQAGGGRELNTLRHINNLTAYWNNKDFQPTYNTLDARAGFRMSPITGMWFNLYGGYRITENELFFTDPHGLEAGRGLHRANILQGKAKVPNFGAEVRYNYRDIFITSLSVEGSDYRIDNLENSDLDYILGNKPKLDVNFMANASITTRLRVGGGWRYIQRHGNYTEDYNNLHINTAYDIFKWLTATASATNILNKKCYRYGYPEEKIAATIGIIARF